MNTIAIIGAMPSELADIRKILDNAEVKKISGFEFFVKEYKGKTIINSCCGIAKVNSALCTQVMIDNFNPDCIINTGIAGGMNSDVKVCDVVISTEVLPRKLFTENSLHTFSATCIKFSSALKIAQYGG